MISLSVVSRRNKAASLPSRSLLVLGLSLAMCVLIAPAAHAAAWVEGETEADATVEGRVTDQTGATLSGVKISVG